MHSCISLPLAYSLFFELLTPSFVTVDVILHKSSSIQSLAGSPAERGDIGHYLRVVNQEVNCDTRNAIDAWSRLSLCVERDDLVDNRVVDFHVHE